MHTYHLCAEIIDLCHVGLFMFVFNYMLCGATRSVPSRGLITIVRFYLLEGVRGGM